MPDPKPITKENPYKIVFVCLGNICRSPTAEGVMQHLVNERGLQSYFYIDSAGTSAYHIGEPANSKAQKVANERGFELKSRARRFEAEDLKEFDLILAMDRENYQNILAMDRENYQNILALDEANNYSDKLKLMREFDPKSADNAEVPDPYYGGMDGFNNVFDIVQRSCENLLDELEERVER